MGEARDIIEMYKFPEPANVTFYKSVQPTASVGGVYILLKVVPLCPGNIYSSV